MARYAGGMAARRPYPSDLSDARWALVEPPLTAWREREHRAGLGIGRPPRHGLRAILGAILYVGRTGIPWRYLRHEYPPWETVYSYFARWQKDGVFEQLSGLLRRLARAAEGRDPEPAACVIDSQSVKTAATVPAARRRAPAPRRRSWAASGASSPARSGCCWWCWSPPPACKTARPACSC